MTYRKLQKELEKKIKKDFGKRCKDVALGCIVCWVWKTVDGIKELADFDDPKLWKKSKK